MKRRRLLTGLALLSLTAYGCSGPGEPAPFETGSGDLAARLEADTGVKWDVYANATGLDAGGNLVCQ